MPGNRQYALTHSIPKAATFDDWDAGRSPGSVLDSLTDSVAILDPTGLILAVNRAWRDFAAANATVRPGSLHAEGANYLHVCERASGKDAEGAREFATGVRDVFAGGLDEFTHEYPCHSPERKRWFIGRVTRLAGAGPPRAMVAHEDITERKLMREALGRSETRLQTVLDHVRATIFLKDLDGRYLLVNKRFAELSGRSKEAMVGKTDYDLLPSEIADASRVNDRRALEERVPVEAEEVAPYDDGPHTSIVIKAPLLDADGVPFAICGIATDITDRKRAEVALRENESVLRGFFDGVPAALVVAEVRGGDLRIITSNASLARLLWRPSVAAPEHPADKVEIPIEHRQRWLRGYREACLTGQPAGFEQAWETAEGLGWFDVLVNPIAEEPECRPRFWVVIQDITERKRSEREIFDLNAELEARLERISSLREIDLAITGSIHLPLTLGIVLDQVLNRLEVDAAGILLCSPQMPALEYVVGKGYRGGARPGSWRRLDEGPAGLAVLEGRTQHIHDPADMPMTGSELFRAEGFVAYWAVALLVKGQVKGVLEVGNRSPIAPEPEWLEYLEALARQAAIAVDNAELFEGFRRSNLELSMAYDATIEGWSRAMDLRDHETDGHSRRVTEMSLRLARQMGINETELIHIRRGALLHDIGKIGIPDCILLKPGPLTDEEFAVMRQHPKYAMEMLAPIAFLRPALDIPYCHHERWDGTGYPRGLKGEQISTAARIFAAVDIWDALRSDRPYRKKWPREKVHEHLRTLSGTHLDSSVVEAFLGILAEESAIPAPV